MSITTYPSGAAITADILNSPESVLHFWFGTSEQFDELDYITYMMRLWFGQGSSLFDSIQSKNKDLLRVLASDALPESWTSPIGYLARIIVLDQFSRSIHRGTADAFAYDSLVSSLCCEVVNQQWISHYTVIQQFFVGVALQHSESIIHQEMGVSIANSIINGNNTELGKYFGSLKGYPHEHIEVIQKFGRFPSRNEILDRESTEAEVEWLDSPDCPAWAKSQVKKVCASK